MKNIGLVLEGGGMRGTYTAGVLDFFMENSLYFPYVIGVSAGACNGSSYVSKQIGRNKTINIDFISDPRYISIKNLIKEKSLFGMNFLFDDLPNRLVPFDFDSFYKSPVKFLAGTTDCTNGEAVYFDKEDKHDFLQVLRASSSLPFLSPMVEINGKKLLDGGIIDPIPIRKSLSDGNEKNIIVLTQNRGYRKEPFKFKHLAHRRYANYEGLLKAILNRHSIYNDTLDYINQLEAEGKAFVIRPLEKLTVDRMEKNPQKLLSLYKEGYEEAKNYYNKLISWLN